MTKFINIVTNWAGLLIIPIFVYSVFVLDKVNWSDALYAVFAAMILIYIKNNRAGKLFDKITDQIVQFYASKNK